MLQSQISLNLVRILNNTSRCSVYDDSEIDYAESLKMLQSKLKDNAKRAIDYLVVCGENYSQAGGL